ncbi:MFS transporter [Parafrankia soli]|uniref:MFS transporter n=1 Tax=Parafrankia soli TaxID=2599596 RepID=A0A1S1QRN4_9ACTN|nr:MFS transporter [Parafrankia soli]
MPADPDAHAHAHAVPAGRAGRREWTGLAVLALPTLLLSLDLSVLYLALPGLTEDLRPSATQLLWITDSYGFLIAGFLVTMGTLGDRVGRRRLLLAGAVAFALTSVLAAWATSPTMLIAARALLGIAGATLMPSTLALISNMFTDERQRSTAVAVWMSCFLAGMAAGPVLGGLLLEYFWWGSVFLLGVPVMALLVVTAPVLLPEYRHPGEGRLDLVSATMSLLAVLAVVNGLKETAAGGPSPGAGGSVAVGLLVGWLFIRRQRGRADPFVDVGLFANRSFTAALGLILFGAFVMGGINLFVTQYLQLVAGLTPLRAGLWLAPATLAVIGTSLAAPVAARWIGAGRVVAAGLGVSAVGLAILTRAGDGGLILLGFGFVLVFLGVGPLGVLGTDLVVGSAPPARAGSAASLSETGSELGVALGVALLGSLGTAVYRHRLAAAIDSGSPAGGAGRSAPAGPADADRESLAGAVRAARSLADGGTAVLEPARDAFTAGLHTVAAVGCALAVLFAVLSVLLFRSGAVGGMTASDSTTGDVTAAEQTIGMNSDEEDGAADGRGDAAF